MYAVGVVEKDCIVDGSKIEQGDVVVGLASNGLHSNGYSLVRHVLFDLHNLNVNDEWEGSGGKLYEELLKPTRIYVKPVLRVLEKHSVKGMVHITGGGLPGNIKRIIPDGLMASIHVDIESVPRIFRYIMELGNVAFNEMCSTFNMGIGYVLIVKADDQSTIIDLLIEAGEKARVIGVIEKSTDNKKVEIS